MSDWLTDWLTRFIYSTLFDLIRYKKVTTANEWIVNKTIDSIVCRSSWHKHIGQNILESTESIHLFQFSQPNKEQQQQQQIENKQFARIKALIYTLHVLRRFLVIMFKRHRIQTFKVILSVCVCESVFLGD